MKLCEAGWDWRISTVGRFGVLKGPKQWNKGNRRVMNQSFLVDELTK